MPTWPSTLPQEFEIEGYQDGLPDQAIRSDVSGEIGQSRRLARRSERTPIRGSMLITTSQWHDVRDFFYRELGNGALGFEFPTLDGLATMTVRFASPPRIKPLGFQTHRLEMQLVRQR